MKTPGPIYYMEETGVLLRRLDGDPGFLPDQILWPSGWRPIPGQTMASANVYPDRCTANGVPHPASWLEIVRISEAEARSLARARGLPISGWGDGSRTSHARRRVGSPPCPIH